MTVPILLPTLTMFILYMANLLSPGNISWLTQHGQWHPQMWTQTSQYISGTDIEVARPRQGSNGQASPWWRHQMETFSALLAVCVGNSPAPGEFPAQRPVTWSFDAFFDLRLNKWLSKQSWGWWFETPSHPLWCHRNACTRVPLWL